jgi:hypothetical protein
MGERRAARFPSEIDQEALALDPAAAQCGDR